ncbi:hypothetical protein CYMTET_22484 [Cymbomonas tetramitiformis]|uniref:Uncharacterized protein n=1 Tax=Cymbomonas tetramitiformis TaxID=36881 RepID=A0AAE0G050_9CHLO|nr:hypothetical protein CYMTET_22484 [Cymbomonas tetramitiformis]
MLYQWRDPMCYGVLAHRLARGEQLDHPSIGPDGLKHDEMLLCILGKTDAKLEAELQRSTQAEYRSKAEQFRRNHVVHNCVRRIPRTSKKSELQLVTDKAALLQLRAYTVLACITFGGQTLVLAIAAEARESGLREAVD